MIFHLRLLNLYFDLAINNWANSEKLLKSYIDLFHKKKKKNYKNIQLVQ